MAEEPENGPDLQNLRNAVRDAVESGRDLQARVRDLMLAAFSSSGMDPSRIREVTRATLEGVGASTAFHGAASGEKAQQAVDGIQEALMQAAEVSSLAIREAAGHASEFARSDLRHAVDELASLEKLFLDTLAEVARSGSVTAKAGFADIQRHLQHSGSAFGEQLATHVSTLRQLLSQTGQEGLQSGAQVAGKAAEQLGRLAGALLAGIREGLADSAAKHTGHGGRDAGGKEES